MRKETFAPSVGSRTDRKDNSNRFIVPDLFGGGDFEAADWFILAPLQAAKNPASPITHAAPFQDAKHDTKAISICCSIFGLPKNDKLN